MSRHENFVRKSWDELLARDDIVGGNLYFVEDGHTYVGRIRKVENRSNTVAFFLEWCGYKTQHDGWTRRERFMVTRQKVRLKFLPTGSVHLGTDQLFFKGQNSFEADQLRKPLNVAERREAKRKRAEVEGPGPLFAARP